VLWVLLELNNIAFIYLFVLGGKTTSHMPINFFIVQTISSLSIITYIIINHKTAQELLRVEISYILLIGLLIKISLPPFHTWILKISKIASWSINIIFISWQKTIPILIIIKFQKIFFTFIRIIFLRIGTLLQFMFVKIKPLVISSSIVHIGWIIIPHNINKMFPFFYLTIYTLIILPMIIILRKINKWKLIKIQQKNNFILALNIFNLRRIPPLAGFILKWIVFMSLIQGKTNIVYLIILFAIATIRFFIYFQIIYNTLLKNWIDKKSKNNNLTYPKYSLFLRLTTITLPIFIIL